MSSLTPDHAYFFVVDGYELDRKNIQDVTVVKGSDHFRSFGFPCLLFYCLFSLEICTCEIMFAVASVQTVCN